MATQRTQNHIPVFTLTSSDGPAQAEVVPQLGGTVSSLLLPDSHGPRECLYQHEWFWDPLTEETRGGIPLLFPVCGRLLKDGTPGLYPVDGKPFHLPIHGFAMRLPWDVADSSQPDGLRLRLSDSARTRLVYPFAFGLELHFRISSDSLSIQLTVTNTGTSPMPYAAGFHPYFSTPPVGKGKDKVTFSADARKGCIYNETKTDIIATAHPPSFPKSVSDEESHSMLLEMDPSGTSQLHFPDSRPLTLHATSLFRYRQFYTLPNEPFFCDEPWMAPPNTLNHSDTVHHLAPGQSECGRFRISLTRS